MVFPPAASGPRLWGSPVSPARSADDRPRAKRAIPLPPSLRFIVGWGSAGKAPARPHIRLSRRPYSVLSDDRSRSFHGCLPVASRPPMTVAFYAPQKAPDDPVPSGDRQLSRLMMAAINRIGRPTLLASHFRSFDKTGDADRQARLAALGPRVAERLIGHLRSLPPTRRPDLWFTCAPSARAPDWLGPPVAEALGIPYVIAEAGFEPASVDGPWSLGGRQMSRALAQAGRVIRLNGGDPALLSPIVPDTRRLASLQPFIDTARFNDVDADAVREAMARSHGLDPGRPWLLAVAMMRSGRKVASYRLLGRGLRHVPGRSFHLLVAGDGPARPEVEQALSPLKPLYLGELGPQRLVPLYAACDLLVWPALGESFGMALLEAQAAGVPVVAGRSGAASVVHDEKTGLIVPEGDADALAEAVAFLLLNPSLRHTMGRQAAWWVQREHSLEAAAWRLQSLLQDLAPAGDNGP
ncbi:glycosyl transferase family 1 [Rhodospirillum rubrum]|nr:glycosyl transferase family 1 [Rhodospirillum rubrum]MBK1678275.1 glycosyl transferase family 1 [Rhodospirillum rubrum]